MPKYKVVLFDVDGVLLKPPMYFSHHYAEESGLDKNKFDEFFAKYARNAAKGETDYKTLIEANNDIWQWDKTAEELLDKWFAYENQPISELLELIKDLKKQGIKVFLASDQDKYRGKYLNEVVFKDMLDGAFFSSALGYVKIEPEFFIKVMAELQKHLPDLKPRQIVFFDDSPENIEVAKSQGISAFLYKSPAHVKKILS
ncbi:MAG TPA: HAD-IA family hydrolase [Candidatus Saccharimonadales bacterium]|nr:HAD-IA family hydrolase [Candidatus Saccharimonadales bacterium]